MSCVHDDSYVMHRRGPGLARGGKPFMLAGLLVLTIALWACGNPTNARSTPTGTASGGGLAVATPTPPRAAASLSATAFTGTPSPLRTPALPMDSTCSLINKSATPTAAALAQAHGNPISCYQVDRTVIVSVPGGDDQRPGFLQCAQPPDATEDYCGVELAPVIARDRSYADNWQFLPFPAADAREVGLAAFPQLYECVGNSSQTWTFHFDTLMYTQGCTPPPSIEYGTTPCDGFLYVGMGTTPDLYATYGKPAGCQLYGTTAIGVMDGRPQPGLIVCGPVSSVEQLRPVCGFDLGGPPVALSVWKFIPLPVAPGPVTGATFDTAAGTACVTAAGQSFTFTLATMAVTAGCSPAPAATTTP